MSNVFNREPVLLLGSAGILIHDGLALLIAFGVHISTAQETAIVTFVGTVLTFWMRSRVTPVLPKA